MDATIVGTGRCDGCFDDVTIVDVCGFGRWCCGAAAVSGGLRGGRTPLGSGPTRQLELLALRHFFIYSVNAVNLSSGMSLAPTWLLMETQLEKQRPQMNQRGHMVMSSSQMTGSTFLDAKVAAHVSPVFILKDSGWDGLFTPTLLFVFFAAASSSPCRLPDPDGDVLLRFLFSLLLVSILEKVGGSLASKFPKRTELTRAVKSRVESST